MLDQWLASLFPWPRQTGIFTRLIANWRQAGNSFARTGNCATRPNPADRADPPSLSATSVQPQATRTPADLRLAASTLLSPPSYAANLAILPSPCSFQPLAGTLVHGAPPGKGREPHNWLYDKFPTNQGKNTRGVLPDISPPPRRRNRDQACAFGDPLPIRPRRGWGWCFLARGRGLELGAWSAGNDDLYGTLKSC